MRKAYEQLLHQQRVGAVRQYGAELAADDVQRGQPAGRREGPEHAEPHPAGVDTFGQRASGADAGGHEAQPEGADDLSEVRPREASGVCAVAVLHEAVHAPVVCAGAKGGRSVARLLPRPHGGGGTDGQEVPGGEVVRRTGVLQRELWRDGGRADGGAAHRAEGLWLRAFLPERPAAAPQPA